MKFVVGKMYRIKKGITKRPAFWNPDGLMDAMLDGKPRRCTVSSWRNNSHACLKGLPKGYANDDTWSWEDSLELCSSDEDN